MNDALGLALRNLGAWSLQVGVLAVAAAALARLAPIDRPTPRLALYQVLLVVVLGLPLVQPWMAPTSGDVLWSVAFVPERLAVKPTGAASPLSLTAWWPVAIASLLLLGAVLQLARLAFGLVRLRRLCRDARALDAPAWLEARRDALAPRARLLVSDAAGTPATCGLGRPLVLLPPAFERMARRTQESVALHELVHARRGDWGVLLLEELLKAVLFFHPAVRWLVGRVCVAREQVVDAAVVEQLGVREAYVDSLLEVAISAARARAVPAAPFLHHSHLRERVDLLLKEVAMSRVRALGHAALTSTALVLAVSWAVAAAPLQSSAPAAPGSSARLSADPVSASVNVRDDVAAPSATRLVHKVQPAYPSEAKAEKVEGIFVIDVVIGKDGAVSEAQVVASAPTAAALEQINEKRGTPAGLTGDARLAEAALTAVRQWRYEPVLKQGQPVEFKATVTINFRLS
jgi:beta-lactamase regulating signal transducer with metallopeptidase domain